MTAIQGGDPRAGGSLGSLPAWFKPERFLDAEFSPEEYISDLKRYVPLEVLAGELGSHARQLRAQLAEVLNAEYEQFAQLGVRLAGVRSAAARMGPMLLGVRGRLEDLSKRVRDEEARLAEGLQRRSEAAQDRERLELMRDAAAVAAKVERLLAEVTAKGVAGGEGGAGAGGGGGAGGGVRAGSDAVPRPVAPNPSTASMSAHLEAECQLLGRLASELSRLEFYVSKGEGLAFFNTLAPRAAEVGRELEAALAAALCDALAARDAGALSACLTALAAIGRPAAASRAVREACVVPLCERASRAALARHDGSAGAAWPTFLAYVEVGAREGTGAIPGGDGGARGDGREPGSATSDPPALGPFLDHALEPRPGAGAGPFDFLGDSVLVEVDRWLAGTFSAASSPGNPAQFRENFEASLGFLAALEGYARSSAQVEAFRAGPAHATHAQRWNVQAYYSIMFHQLAGGLEAALGDADTHGLDSVLAVGGDADADTPVSARALVAPARLRTAPARAAWAVLAACVDGQVVPRALAGRFMSLGAQAALRLSAWARAAVEADEDARDRRAQTQAAAAQQVADSGTGDGDTLAPSPAPEPASPEALALLSADLAAVADGLEDAWADALATLIGADDGEGEGSEGGEGGEDEGADRGGGAPAAPGPDPAEATADGSPAAPPRPRASVAAAVTPSAAALRAASDRALGSAATLLSADCASALRQLRGIVATFRMTSRAAPSRPSQYVQALMHPARAFLAGLGADGLPEAQAVALLALVAGQVSDRYRALAADTLENVRRTEDSLRRFKARGRAAAAPGGADAPAAQADTGELIAQQLLLDARAFGKLLAADGVDPDALPEFQGLLLAVGERGGARALAAA